MPQAGLGGDLAVRHALEMDTYDMYCGHTCSLVAVDVQATAKAFGEKIVNAIAIGHIPIDWLKQKTRLAAGQALDQTILSCAANSSRSTSFSRMTLS
jgi:hypothetical protein